jgi:hypothetical protein
MTNSDPISNASTTALLRATLDEVFIDYRFFVRRSLFPCQIAQYVLTKIRQGERDPGRLKTATLEKINRDYRIHEYPGMGGKRGTADADLSLDPSDVMLLSAAWAAFNE